MNGFLLLIPFLLIRFFLLSKRSKDGIKRAAHFPPMEGKEKPAYWIYQISNIAIVVYLCFIRVSLKAIWIVALGFVLYLLGLLLCAAAITGFASPLENGLNNSGIYRYSRNPMYVSYFLLFIGCSVLTDSVILFVITIIFQISTHWIILSEERWCMEKFGQSYREYMSKTRRYI